MSDNYNIDDARFMDLAFSHAEEALQRGDLPVGAVVALDGQIVSASSNMNTSEKTWLSHAEQNALRTAGQRLRYEYEVNGRSGSLYSSLEPCVMCISHAIFCRISTIYFGGTDKKYSGISILDLGANDYYARLRPAIVGPTHQMRCEELFGFYQPKWPFDNLQEIK
ncbi:nucleoside deaminase [Rhizobium leguminosarum]|uniref:nucleoside deaminase n=1 Tax=Rhizobium leguminosarum TaxID=384 RepID=UPI000DD5642E|nr:nucleoside deaminase [Rhizobium leguminosarum]